MKKIVSIIFLGFSICCILILFENNSIAYRNSRNIEEKTTANTYHEKETKNTLQEYKNIPKIITVAIVGGMAFSSIICGVFVAKHKPVKEAKAANNYLNRNKVSFTRREDFFIKSTIDKQSK